jgi:hypothetical protein
MQRQSNKTPHRHHLQPAAAAAVLQQGQKEHLGTAAKCRS